MGLQCFLGGAKVSQARLDPPLLPAELHLVDPAAVPQRSQGKLSRCRDTRLQRFRPSLSAAVQGFSLLPLSLAVARTDNLTRLGAFLLRLKVWLPRLNP